MNVTPTVELSDQDARILDFLRSMGAFADMKSHTSGNGVSLQDINSLFGECKNLLDALIKKDCVYQGMADGYDTNGGPIKVPCYYIKSTGAFSLYKREKQ